MTYQLGYATEQEYHDDCALEGRNARLAAEACNDILTARQADFALACLRQNADEAVALVESLFDTHGWPADDLDQNWLDDAGRVTWELFQAYRSIGA